MSPKKPTLTTAKKALKEYFGYESFHALQKKAISSVLAGQDTFVLMPTGGGKSMCFQIPAVIIPGTTIVVSPLIALMKDQVDGLKANGIAAEFLNSSLDSAEQSQVIEALLAGSLDLLYVSAERLVTAEFMELLKKIKVNLFAIDEAHCISSWGHDFRPEYTQLSHLKQQFPGVPIIALTATADRTTREDILTQLELDEPQILIDSFDRPNISLTVLPAQKRIDAIREFLADKPNQSGIVYCLTRKETEKVAEKIQKMGHSAASYHAGMSAAERERIQKSFVLDKTQIICATIAFGMGIDKSNVRWVIHYNLPKNIEGYYQEIGRAGRDSAPAEALLFYTYADYEMMKRFFVDSSQQDVQLGKLDRMKEYAEGVICRRKILLNSFDETYAKSCGNCDVCEDPYPTRNGTAITKKALEVLQTMDAEGAVNQDDVVRVLRNVSDAVNFASWHFYLAQMKNLGLIRVDFSQDAALHITEAGQEVLAGKREVRLVTLNDFMERQEQAKKVARSAGRSGSKKKKEYYKNPLFEKLRQVRLEIAQENSLAAYMVFSDATLLEMANEKPSNKQEMLAISGVGEVKWERYGERFLAAFRNVI
ncbi:DNA helicase RecQ [Candidatus Woesebacteria bacterium]|nr:DNA helicase RecQ [Candidatus Woesebacteria bacterium]MCD8545786.1 DNA helicase RecQ [Candidatus Woesebacteria bacterium]